jgi:hypothetical protein
MALVYGTFQVEDGCRAVQQLGLPVQSHVTLQLFALAPLQSRMDAHGRMDASQPRNYPPGFGVIVVSQKLQSYKYKCFSGL